MSQAILIPGVSAFPCGGQRQQERLNPGRFDSEMQNTLVPPVSYKDAAMEAHGKTVPKDEVGGDLVDLVSDGRNVIAYVADVSGHGLRAGVLMGMAKAAMRYGLLLRQPLTRLLADINSVLGTLKEPNMYLTLAVLRFDGSQEVEYILQEIPGHPLCGIAAAVLAEAEDHGAPQDDQTVLLVRSAADEDGSDRAQRPEKDVDNPQVREATWRRLLDELTVELKGE